MSFRLECPHCGLRDVNEFRFQGEVTINLEIKSPTYTVYFHSRDLSIGSVTAVTGGRTLEGVVSDAAGAGAESGHGEKVATFAETLPVGPASVRFIFDGPFNEKLTGLYRAKDESGRFA